MKSVWLLRNRRKVKIQIFSFTNRAVSARLGLSCFERKLHETSKCVAFFRFLPLSFLSPPFSLQPNSGIRRCSDGFGFFFSLFMSVLRLVLFFCIEIEKIGEIDLLFLLD